MVLWIVDFSTSKWSLPVTVNTMPANTQTMPTPTRWRRFICMLYEGILLFGLLFGVLLAFDFLTQSRHALFLRDARQVILFMAMGLYFLLSWRKTGQTLPMKTWHMRLQTLNGTKLSWLRALLRYVLMWLIPLFFIFSIYALVTYSANPSIYLLLIFTPFTLFIWTWFDPEQQFLHDRIAGTRIVDIRPHLQS